MNTYMMKRAMIEAAVARGIKEMEEDPERSIRRLVDLGKQFSKNRFQDMIFSVMQELLNNENSAYYDMVYNLLRNSDTEALKRFGINFGYMSWAYGASILRNKEKELGTCLPWTIRLRLDYENPNGLTSQDLSLLFSDAQKLGIYAFFLRETGNATDSYDLLEVLEQYKDSAFIWFRASGRLSAAQIQMLKLCKNTLVSLPAEDPESFLTAALLRDQKIVFAFHAAYDDNSDVDSIESRYPLISERILSSETPFLFAIAKDGTQKLATKLCYDERLAQNHPFLPIDYYGDGESISKVLVEHSYLFELDEDRKVIHPDSGKGIQYEPGTSLEEFFQKCMPAWQ